MKSIGLEGYLKKYAPERYATYKQIEKAVRKIWKVPRLLWFTDHGPDHSERIISLLDQLCDGLLLLPEDNHPHYGLTTAEVFLLLSSAWLHDIGMQDLSGLGVPSVDAMNEDGWDLIRRRHPQRAFEIIMDYAVGSDIDNEFWVGLRPDDKVHGPLALICKGHGSEYFDEVVDVFQKRTFNLDGKEKKIRGELVTSLLLLADELDLHYSRASIEANYPISSISKLHYFRHHYIEDVKIFNNTDNGTETDKKISITFAFPEGDMEWKNDLVKWVSVKLKKELERTFPHIRKGFKGHFFWADPPIQPKQQPALPKEKKVMEAETECLLKLQLQNVIDWKANYSELRKFFINREPGVIHFKASEQQGSNLFLSFLEYLFYGVVGFERSESSIAIIDFKSILRHHNVVEIFQDVGEMLGVDFSLCPRSKPPSDKVDALMSCINETNRFCLVVFQNMDDADPGLRDAIIETLKNKFTSSNSKFLVIVNSNKEIPCSAFSVMNLPDNFSKDDIFDYFIREGNSGESAENLTVQIMQIQAMNKSALDMIQIAKILNGPDRFGHWDT